MEFTVVNGQPAALVYLDGELDTVALVESDADRVSTVYAVRNQAKLARLSDSQQLSRLS